MTSIADSSVKIQTTSESNLSPPSWFGEVVLLISSLRKHGVLTKISEGVRFARRRFGHYEVIDFLSVQIALCHQWRTHRWREFYKQLQPFAVPFMAGAGAGPVALPFGALPFFSGVDGGTRRSAAHPVDFPICSAVPSPAPRMRSKSRVWWIEQEPPGWCLTSMARVKPLVNAPYPRATTCPQPFADWMRSVRLATGGASVGKWSARARSSARLTAESRLGSFGHRGNGRYREELRQGLAAIGRYLTASQLPPEQRTLLHIFGQYGTGAVLADLAGFAFVTRGKEYTALDHPLVQARLHLPPDQSQQRPESQVVRSLYDCPQVPVGPEGVLYRVVVATHPSRATRRVPLASRARGSCTNSFSPTCHNRRSPPLMSLNCTCIAALLSQPFLMRTRRSTRIGGVVIRPGGRSAGR
jgi:hypothetical protein